MSKKLNISSECIFGGQNVSIKTGGFARLADSAVMVQVGETTVLVTVVSRPSTLETDFLPLRIDFEERYYAGGILSGPRYTRREGRPRDQAVVEARLIDHAIRPLFPKDFKDDTQIVITVLSSDQKNSPILAGFLGVSAALSISGLPFSGPIVPLRISKSNGSYKFNLSTEAAEETTEADFIVSYLDNGKKVQAIEAHGHIIPEAEVISVIKEGAATSKSLFDLLVDFANKGNVPVKEYEKSWLNYDSITEFRKPFMDLIDSLTQKGVTNNDYEWQAAFLKLAKELAPQYEDKYTEGQIGILSGEVQKDWVRDVVLKKNTRIDGRKDDEIRPLEAKVSVLPRVHGSALFARGLTQALSIATLGSSTEKQVIQSMHGESKKRYMHHYNFPPYSTGETGKMGSTGRREIGHGMLAEKALIPVLPPEGDFPYAIRLVSEILSSNGSTSMASTCGSSLALMDAGVPIKAHVAGIGVGLFVDKTKETLQVSDYKLLTDIMGVEDYAGYMDFKLTGTREGMTAIQLELKLQGLPLEVLDHMFEASKKARMKVLEVMEQAISEPRKQLGALVPKIDMVRINKDQIGLVIGSGGSTIRGLMETSHTQIDVEEDAEGATVTIVAIDPEDLKKAREMIIGMTREYNVGDEVEGVVTRVEPYGVFVEFALKQEGLLHVSEYSYDFVEDISSLVNLGDRIKAKVISTENGKIALSAKALLPKPEGYVEPIREPRRPSGRGFNNRGGGRSFDRRNSYNRR